MNMEIPQSQQRYSISNHNHGHIGGIMSSCPAALEHVSEHGLSDVFNNSPSSTLYEANYSSSVKQPSTMTTMPLNQHDMFMIDAQTKLGSDLADLDDLLSMDISQFTEPKSETLELNCPAVAWSPIPEGCLFAMEEEMSELNETEPTLAQLNGDDSLGFLDEIICQNNFSAPPLFTSSQVTGSVPANSSLMSVIKQESPVGISVESQSCPTSYLVHPMIKPDKEHKALPLSIPRSNTMPIDTPFLGGTPPPATWARHPPAPLSSSLEIGLEDLNIHHVGSPLVNQNSPLKDEGDNDDESSSDSDADTFLDDKALIDGSFLEDFSSGSGKEKRYFWQYNTQSKGPKGKRLCKSMDSSDPHILDDFEDPVFDPDMSEAKYKHNGKARRGDGNDITPSPIKLLQLGSELSQLDRIIHDLLPPGDKPLSRKEKNKLASRACRLKKKAQHEANKVKLYGLQHEHSMLIDIIKEMKSLFVERISAGKNQSLTSLANHLATLLESYQDHIVAGDSIEYVNKCLAAVQKGDPNGGLDL